MGCLGARFQLAWWIALFLGLWPVAAHAEPAVPSFRDPQQRLARPDPLALPRLRFLTTTDFFPFNFLDSDGRLSGFHVDLARLVCAELDLAERCQIQALPWDELESALLGGQGEAILAGISVNRENREKYNFSGPYMRFPARLVTRVGNPLGEPHHETLVEKRVGILAASAHEHLLYDLFPDARAVVYDRMETMLGELKAGNLDAVFGDGMRLAFWLAGSDAAQCCAFSGGPYLAPRYLGQGLAVAVPVDDLDLARAIDFALLEIERSGAFAELYLRYFPVDFY